MTTYMNIATGCSAQIEKSGEGWALAAVDSDGNVERSVHRSRKAAYRAMLEFEHGWQEVPESRERRARSEFKSLCDEAAARFLGRRGFRILERDWGCPLGTVDIIAEHGDAVVFVEVRGRAGAADGPFPALRRERKGFESIACLYAAERLHHNAEVRYDVVDVTRTRGDQLFVRHHVGVDLV